MKMNEIIPFHAFVLLFLFFLYICAIAWAFGQYLGEVIKLKWSIEKSLRNMRRRAVKIQNEFNEGENSGRKHNNS